jgi:hypothetical protein
MTLIVAKLRYTVYRYCHETALMKDAPRVSAVKNGLPIEPHQHSAAPASYTDDAC